jgi:antitoxin component YwqK of YwqJK toxin-antitoxin module
MAIGKSTFLINYVQLGHISMVNVMAFGKFITLKEHLNKQNSMQDNNQRNAKGYRHGLWESYWDKGEIYYRTTYDNGDPHGLSIWYHQNGNVWYKGNYNKGKQIGYWEWYNSDGKLENTEYFAN